MSLRILAVVVAASIALPAAAQSDAPTVVGKFVGWTVYTMPDGKRQTCYVLGEPDKPDTTVTRAKPDLMVTHRPQEKTFNVVSIDLGTDLPANGSAEVAVGKTSFDFFTRDHTAWARDPDTDKATVTAMAQSQSLIVKVKPAKGKPIADSYALAGFKDALAALDKACNYRR